MTEEISRFLDNDLSPNETSNLLQKVAEQPELKAKLNRYAAISHAMKTDDFLWVSDDFASRIQQEIQQIPEIAVVHVLPVRKRYYGFALAAAASVAAVAMLASGFLDGLVKQPTQPATFPLAKQTQTPKPSVQLVYQNPHSPPHQVNTRINDYLQEHNNSGYSNGEAFVRLATYDQQ